MSHVHGDPTLRAVLQDIFVAVAILTISVGLVLPGMIGQSARQLSGAATRLAAGTLSDLTKAMQALARGDLNAAHARKEILELRAYSRDELGEMADTFNVMQKEIARTAVALDGAREGLAQTKQELAQYAAEQAQLARTEQVMREATDRANQAKSEFLSRVSHELRTPLNAILGFGQLLELENLSDGQRDSLDQILIGGRHLLEVIDELLDISRIETENIGLSVEPLDVRASIEEAVALCEPLAAERGLTLRVHNYREPVWAKADAQRLKQVILNLISNAIKYNRPAGSVTVEAVAEEADVVRISVTDTGTGIDELELDRLFTPFERLSAPARGVEGTGLGLALSKTLIEAMGGRIEVRSRAGVGSTFCVVLEASEEPDVVAECGPVPAAPVEAACSDSCATVLCIEDNPANLRVIEQLLARSLTASVIAAPTGKLGLELARIRQPDVILLDLHLPDCNGETVLSALRSDPATAAIPVVVITADASAGRIKRLMALGADHYLTKPIHARRLVRTLEQHLGVPSASAVA